jgi:hypothetical protein
VERQAQRDGALGDFVHGGVKMADLPDKMFIPAPKIVPMPPVMSPEQFAYWVKGIAEGHVARTDTLDGMLGRILDAARSVR